MTVLEGQYEIIISLNTDAM